MLIKAIFDFNPKVVEDHLPGLWAHCTVRADKSDVFPYPPLIEALKEVQTEIIGLKKVKIIPETPIMVPKSAIKSKSKKVKS